MLMWQTNYTIEYQVFIEPSILSNIICLHNYAKLSNFYPINMSYHNLLNYVTIVSRN